MVYNNTEQTTTIGITVCNVLSESEKSLLLLLLSSSSSSLSSLLLLRIELQRKKKRIMSTHLHQSSIMDVPLLIGEGNLI
jgi:hypothetical protein